MDVPIYLMTTLFYVNFLEFFHFQPYRFPVGRLARSAPSTVQPRDGRGWTRGAVPDYMLGGT